MAYQTDGKAARDTFDSMGDAADKAVRMGGAAAKSAAHDMSAAVEGASELAQEKIDSMANYVRRNPLQATAIAAGVGFVFALIARR
jgi:ElaB/YqjD/DUF883 family membrane-anchored ribosome-binding protein